MTNSADPDQLVSSEANRSGSTLFAKTGISGFSKTRVKSLKLFSLDHENKSNSHMKIYCTLCTAYTDPYISTV